MRDGEHALAVTTGLMHAKGRSVLVGVERAGVEPAYPSVPSWGFRLGLSKYAPEALPLLYLRLRASFLSRFLAYFL